MIQQKHWLTCLRNSWVFRLPCHTWLRQCHWMLYCQTRLFWCTTSWCSYVRLTCRTSGKVNSYSCGARTVIIVIQEQLFLWCKNSYSCDTRTVIFKVQEQLLLWCKNSYYCGARIVIFMVQEQLLLYPPFFYCLGHICDTSFAYFSLFFRSFRHILKKNSQLWTVMDTYGQLWTLGLLWFRIFAMCKVGDMRALFSH